MLCIGASWSLCARNLVTPQQRFFRQSGRGCEWHLFFKEALPLFLSALVNVTARERSCSCRYFSTMSNVNLVGFERALEMYRSETRVEFDDIVCIGILRQCSFSFWNAGSCYVKRPHGFFHISILLLCNVISLNSIKFVSKHFNDQAVLFIENIVLDLTVLHAEALYLRTLPDYHYLQHCTRSSCSSNDSEAISSLVRHLLNVHNTLQYLFRLNRQYFRWHSRIYCIAMKNRLFGQLILYSTYGSNNLTLANSIKDTELPRNPSVYRW